MVIQANSSKWEECRMKALCIGAPTAWLRLLMLTSLALLGFTCKTEAIAAIQCSNYQPYTLKIFNDSKVFNIYPVIATPTNDADEWLQGAAQILDSQKVTLTYGHKFVYRVYINPTVGIVPHGSVTVTLPLCSQLAANPDPTKSDQYINWWNGGRVYIYENLKSLGEPPAELVADFTKDQANPVSPLTLTPRPSCVGCSGVPNPPIYKSETALPPNDPAQLTEYTLTGLDKGNKKINPDPTWQLILKIVDYDISYVDHVYLPGAMGRSTTRISVISGRYKTWASLNRLWTVSFSTTMAGRDISIRSRRRLICGFLVPTTALLNMMRRKKR
jgi:hypothetical protein